MTTEFPEQESDSDLCVHRASAVKCYRARFNEIQINPRGTMGTEFPEQSLSDLCVHRDSAVKSDRAGCSEIQINHRGTMGTEISEEEFYQTSVFIVSLG